MKGFLRNLFQKTGKSTEPLPEQEKKERPPNGEDGYMRYCIELEQALRDLETYLLTCDDSKEIAMQALKTACTFYGGDWAGTLEVDLDFDVWAPVWCHNPGIQDRTNQLILEFESSASMPRWINAMRLGKNIVIPDVNAIREENAAEYAVYERLFVQSLIAVPFIPSPTGFLVIRNPSRYIDRSSMLSALAHVLHRAMAQQKAIESAKLAPTPDLIQSSKDVAINFFGDMEICTKKGVLSERFFNSPKSSRVITYIILNPKTAHPPLEIYHALWPDECVEPEVAGRNIRGYTATKQMEQQVLNLLNGLIASPERITLPETENLPQPPVQVLQRELDTLIDQQPIDEEAAQKLILAIAAARYSSINPNQCETIWLRRLFSKHELMTELDAELLQSSVSAILCYRDGTMDIQLKNHQMIGRSETV